MYGILYYERVKIKCFEKNWQYVYGWSTTVFCNIPANKLVKGVWLVRLYLFAAESRVNIAKYPMNKSLYYASACQNLKNSLKLTFFRNSAVKIWEINANWHPRDARSGPTPYAGTSASSASMRATAEHRNVLWFFKKFQKTSNFPLFILACDGRCDAWNHIMRL